MTEPGLFDPGLQPERTALAWRRTALAIATGSLVCARLFSDALDHPLWALPAVAGVGLAGWMWSSAGHRYAAFATDIAAGAQEPRCAGAAGLLVTALVIAVAGAAAAAVVIASVVMS